MHLQKVSKITYTFHGPFEQTIIVCIYFIYLKGIRLCSLPTLTPNEGSISQQMNE
jgi:hypothetical protein